MSHDLSIDEVLEERGFRDAEARRRARAALVDAGLTQPHKQRIAAGKLERVHAVLAARFAIVCARAECRRQAPSDREVVDAGRSTDCSICGGGANQPAIDRAIAALGQRGLRRVVVVGGSPSTHEELRALVRDRLELRLVSGTDRRTGRDAGADLAWADVIAVWAGTELDHKVSQLYTAARDRKVVTCGRRGIAALADTLAIAASRR